ncbi:unnamed protein product [Laminaria digitata]
MLDVDSSSGGRIAIIECMISPTKQYYKYRLLAGERPLGEPERGSFDCNYLHRDVTPWVGSEYYRRNFEVIPVWSTASIFSVKGGEMAAKRGYCINLVELRGHTPPNCSQKGGLLCTLLRHGATSRNTVPEKRKRNGARARHGLQAPCQRVRIDSEARWSTWERLPRACVAYTPFWLQKPGVCPPLTVSESIISAAAKAR